mgnify:CR=1 FL=1
MIYDGTDLKTYSFNNSLTDPQSFTVTKTLYTGVTITDPTNTFDVSDYCDAIRINDKIFHWYYPSFSFLLDIY